MGETEETVLTFPGNFKVSDALAQSNIWVRKAEPHEKADYNKVFKEGNRVTNMGFVEVPRIRVLYHSDWQRAFGEQIMAVKGQEHMYGMATDEAPAKEDFIEVEKLINLDDIKTPRTPSEY